MLLLARVISLIANPVVLFLPVPYFLVEKTTKNFLTALQWTEFSWLFLGVLCFFVLYEVRIGTFTDIDVSRREQRPRLFLFVALLALLYALAVYLFHGPSILYLISFGSLLGIGVVDIINTRIKASIHVATLTALLCGISLLYGGIYFFLLLLLPISAWARLKTKRHTLIEAVTGAILGLVLTMLMYLIAEVLY